MTSERIWTAGLLVIGDEILSGRTQDRNIAQVDAIAAALGVPVVIHPKARAILEAYYATRGGVTEARLRMARVPEGAELIENKMSGAPGIRLGNIFILA